MDSTTQDATRLYVGDIVRIPSGSEATVESIDLESNTAVCAWNGTRSTFKLETLVWLRPAPRELTAGDVVKLPTGERATVQQLGPGDGYATVMWFDESATGPQTAVYALADLQPAAAHPPVDLTASTGAVAAGEESSETAQETAPLYDAVSRVKTFMEESDREIQEAIRGHVLAEVDQLGPGAHISRDDLHATVTAWRNGTRIHGHGTTTAAALADFHRQAGPTG